jgi:acetate kinase
MIVIVINCGSSSLKFKLFDMGSTNEQLAEGVVEEIGKDSSKFTYCSHKMGPGEKVVRQVRAPDHTAAVGQVAKILLDADVGLFEGSIKVDAVGHRVVHGGEKFSRSALVTKGVKEVIQECAALAPLHNPPNLAGIEACEKIFEGIPQVAVFDTAFHQTMPEHVYLYGLPYQLYERHHIRKYGFHGTSHEYVYRRAIELLDKPAADLNVVTCHLGNGSSITAVKHGKALDTSMGLTPLEGLVMGTRTGDMDPAVVLYVMEKEQLNLEEANTLLNKKSGLKGLSGVSNDLRAIMREAEAGNERARVAIDIFCYRIIKYIGAYAAAMGGVDAVVFTGGIGENATSIRAQVCAPLGFLGLQLDPEKNRISGQEVDISTADSTVKALVIPTNEELSIAQKSRRAVEEASEKYR